jgi:hypothetical protein
VTGFIILVSVKAFIAAGVAVSQYSVWLRTGRPGDRGSIPGRGKRCVQTGSVAQPASYPMGTGVLSPGVKRGRDVTLTTHPHLAQWSWTSRSYTSSPSCASIGVLWDCFKEFIFRGQHTKLVAWLQRYSNQRSQSLSGSNIVPLSDQRYHVNSLQAMTNARKKTSRCAYNTSGAIRNATETNQWSRKHVVKHCCPLLHT